MEGGTKASSRSRRAVVDPYAAILSEETPKPKESKKEAFFKEREPTKHSEIGVKESRYAPLEKPTTRVKTSSSALAGGIEVIKPQVASQSRGVFHSLVEESNSNKPAEVTIIDSEPKKEPRDKKLVRKDKESPIDTKTVKASHKDIPVAVEIEDTKVFKQRTKKDPEVVVELLDDPKPGNKKNSTIVPDRKSRDKDASTSMKNRPIVLDDSDRPNTSQQPQKKDAEASKLLKSESAYKPKPARVEIVEDTPSKMKYKSTEIKRLDHPLFDPLDHCPFNHGQPPPFFFICEGFQMIATMSGTDMVERKKRVFVNMLKAFEILKSDQTADFFFFATGRLDAEYIQGDLGVGDEIIAKACAGACNCATKVIKDDMKTTGDLGTVVENRKGKTQTMHQFFNKSDDSRRLTFEYVFKKINELTKTPGSLDKEALITKLIVEATGLEAKYIIRFLQKGNFKMGCAKAHIQSSLARCFLEILNPAGGAVESWEKALQKCLHQYPNYRFIIQKMRESEGKLTYLYQTCRLTPGVPCKPMLAKPTKEINIIFSRFEGRPFTCEYKYDGLRGQIHYTKDKQLFIYSRNLENMTLQYPDVCENIEKAINPDTKEFIIDSEIVGIDQKTGKVLPFQTLMSRNKKNVDLHSIQNHVCVYIFDCLFMNGASLLERPLSERRAAFMKGFSKVASKVDYAVSKEADDFDSIQEFLFEAVDSGCEGLMVKKVQDDSQYEPCVRSFRWLKLKRDYLEQNLSDSIDLVVIGAKYGEGKRTGSFGTLLLASYNADRDRYETTGMVGSGFTDEHLRMFYDRLSGKVMKTPHESVFLKDLTEILATDVQVSPAYTCGFGKVEPERGLGLRFPRFIKVREDKDAEDCTSSQQIVEWYTQQASVQNAKGKSSKVEDVDDDDDDY